MTSPLDAVKRKARMLQRAFPAHFTLAQAQEATAALLGFRDWYDLVQAQRAGKAVLPPDRLGPEDTGYISLMYRLIVRLVDDYRVAPCEAHAFMLGWGVFLHQLDKPYTPVYQEWLSILEDVDNKSEGQTHEDDLYNDEVSVIVDGVLEGCPGGMRRYWYPSPQRLKAMPAYLRGNNQAFLSSEAAAFVVLSAPNDFSPAQRERAHAFMAQSEPQLLDWHLGASRSGGLPYDKPFVAEARALARTQPEDWFPLSLRWTALPYDLDIRKRHIRAVTPAMKGRDLVDLIDSNGEHRLADVQWLRYKQGSSGFLQWGALNLRHLEPCEPQYASPFKHNPFGATEFSACEGGDLGLGYTPQRERDAETS